MAPKAITRVLQQATLKVARPREDDDVVIVEAANRAAELKTAMEKAHPTTPGTSKGGLAACLTDKSWQEALSGFIASPKFKKIETFLDAEVAAKKEVFPPRSQIFAALNLTPVDSVRVVLIGQDPYHDNNQAHGLCFSVQPGIKVPPSLVNMYKELQTDIPGFVTPNHGYLKAWADQGILMLNASLTVEAHKANSHAKCGWLDFTDAVIAHLNTKCEKLVFLLWGGYAQKKGASISRTKHAVIECAHPSPLSVTKWMGCKTFSRCNAALEAFGKKPIDWRLPKEPLP